MSHEPRNSLLVSRPSGRGPASASDGQLSRREDRDLRLCVGDAINKERREAPGHIRYARTTRVHPSALAI